MTLAARSPLSSARVPLPASLESGIVLTISTECKEPGSECPGLEACLRRPALILLVGVH